MKNSAKKKDYNDSKIVKTFKKVYHNFWRPKTNYKIHYFGKDLVAYKNKLEIPRFYSSF